MSWCGIPASDLAPSIDGVTCKVCLQLAVRPRALRKVSWSEVVYDMAHLLAGPALEPYPPITPTTWHNMRCRQGLAHCRCEYCTADELNINVKAAWEAEQQLRPHRVHAHEFGSLNAAMELAARVRRDGYSKSSAHGSMQSRAEETLKLGAQVQTTQRTDRDSLEIRRARQVVDIERAVQRAFDDEQERRGLTRDQCVTIMLSTYDATHPTKPEDWVDSTGLSVQAIKALLRHGRKAATIALSASGYIPRPRSRVGLDEAIEKRIAETGGL